MAISIHLILHVHTHRFCNSADTVQYILGVLKIYEKIMEDMAVSMIVVAAPGRL